MSGIRRIKLSPYVFNLTYYVHWNLFTFSIVYLNIQYLNYAVYQMYYDKILFIVSLLSSIFVILLTWCQIAKFLRLLKSYESRNRNFNKLTFYRLIRNWIWVNRVTSLLQCVCLQNDGISKLYNIMILAPWFI